MGYKNAFALSAAMLLLPLVTGCAGDGGGTVDTSVAAPESASAEPASNISTTYHFPITGTPAAQEAFDRGLTLAYAFNYGTSEKAFRESVAADPNCAMGWWGVALVNGPHINFPMVPPDRAVKAWEAVTKAQELAPGTTPLEQGLIAALATRYAEHQPEDRSPLDEAYAAAMRQLSEQYSDNADVVTLYAESLMDLHPWDLYTIAGDPQPWTADVVAALEKALNLNPHHPGATHYYIHAIEASNTPERAVVAADNLRAVSANLVSGTSHLIHMPAHIYARVGRWNDAAIANQDAMAADDIFRAANPRPGFFGLYMAHNDHFFAFAAMMQGRSEDAVQAARKMVGRVPPDFLEEYRGAADGYMIFVNEVLMRFGRWEELLAEPAPAENLPLSRALWHMTRGVAHTALNDMEAAERERQSFRLAADAVPEEWTFGNNQAKHILAVASGVLDGEMLAQRGEFNASILRLERAVELEDELRYDEPPDWIQPVRHTLGAVLLRAGMLEGAERVYREDLAKYRENGWSLFGLARALRLQGKEAEAAEVEARFAKAWEFADVKVESSCFCQPGV